VDPTLAVGVGKTHSNCLEDNPVAITIRVSPFTPALAAAALESPLIATRVPAVNVFTAWNVMTFALIENPVMFATCNPNALPESVVEPTPLCVKFAANCVPESPVCRTVNVRPFKYVPVLNPEICTCSPGTKLFTAWNVTTFDEIENEVMGAAELQLEPLQAPNGALISVISVSGAFDPCVNVLVFVLIDATAPASHMLT